MTPEQERELNAQQAANERARRDTFIEHNAQRGMLTLIIPHEAMTGADYLVGVSRDPERLQASIADYQRSGASRITVWDWDAARGTRLVSTFGARSGVPS